MRVSVAACAVAIVLAVAGQSAGAQGGRNNPINPFTLTWATAFVECYPEDAVFCSWVADPQNGARFVKGDATVTRVTMRASGLPTDVAVVEACISLRRDGPSAPYPNIIGGYSELLCWHATRFNGNEEWSVDLDLAATPLFVPGGSTMACGASLHGGTLSGAQAARLDCSLSMKPYKTGPRFRILRFPYIDMGSEPDGSVAVSTYTSSSVFPLKVAAVHLFESWGGANVDATLSEPCLRWAFNTACFNDQVYSSTVNYNSPRELLRVNWSIPLGDSLTATGQQSRPSTDAAFYAFVEIPSTIAVSAENAVRDYGNVDQADLAAWGSAHVSSLSYPYYCHWLSTCDDSIKLARFLALFQPASCLPSSCGLKKNGK